ncbi:MAG: YcgL domain-containing protein [Saccharospirillum sp.]
MTTRDERIMVTIYRSARKAGMYLYLPRKKALTDLPEALLKHFGPAQKVTDMLLGPERRLVRADTARVLEQLRDPGYYLQMPPADSENLLEVYRRENGQRGVSADD